VITTTTRDTQPGPVETTYVSNEVSHHVCDVCGKSFMYPFKYRPWGLPSNVTTSLRPRWMRWLGFGPWKRRIDKDAPCCPCEDCDPDSFRECLIQSATETE